MQIARTLFPTRLEQRVVHETIYQALRLQGRGQLRAELTQALRTGRARRKPYRQPDTRRTRFGDNMVMISDRPRRSKTGLCQATGNLSATLQN